MSDREARALGAGDTITVGDKKYNLKPIRAKHLAELEKEALKYYKRQYIETFVDNADLLGDKIDLSAKVEEVAKWTSDDLPQKKVYSTTILPVTKKMQKWLEEVYGEKPKSDNAYRAIVGMALDSGEITKNKVEELTGASPRQGRARFDEWWVTASFAGMLSFIRYSLEDCGNQDSININEWPFLKVVEAAKLVESLTSADLGNG
jgi:hypothetical protein